MVGRPSPDMIPHRLSPRIHPIHPQSALTIQNITQIHPNNAPDTLGHQTPAYNKRHRQTSSKIQNNSQKIGLEEKNQNQVLHLMCVEKYVDQKTSHRS